MHQNPKHINRYELCHNRANQSNEGKMHDQSECNHLGIQNVLHATFITEGHLLKGII